jgi:hypothetical protein
MPRRPPKTWFDRCTRAVRKRGGATDPKAVCGATWYHRMSPAERRAATRKSERRRRNPMARRRNPLTTTELVVGGLAVVGIGGLVIWAMNNASNSANQSAAQSASLPSSTTTTTSTTSTTGNPIADSLNTLQNLAASSGSDSSGGS